jgi:hypothetical protein
MLADGARPAIGFGQVLIIRRLQTTYFVRTRENTEKVNAEMLKSEPLIGR